MSLVVFSANRGQFDAGSITTGSILRPRTLLLVLSFSIAMSAVSFSEVSLMVMVLEREWRMFTLIGFLSSVGVVAVGVVVGVALGAVEVVVVGAGGVSFLLQTKT